MDSKIGFEINLIVVEAIRGRCASFTVLTATVSEIFGGQTTPSILVLGFFVCLYVCLRYVCHLVRFGILWPRCIYNSSIQCFHRRDVNNISQ